MGWPAQSRQGDDHTHVAVIGAGISGILMAIRLKQRGLSFRVYEKAADVGGTWRDNTYPGLYCDVPAHTYCYSFAPKPSWKTYFASGPDIQKYYRRVVRRFGLTPHIQLDSEVKRAEWDGGQWQLTLADGARARADIIVTAAGRLHHPSTPNLPGLDDFAGPAFHSARWRHDVDFRDKRVGVIGTGSSSAQITVALAPQVRKLHVFQRTPHWVIALPNTPYSLWQRAKFRLFPWTLRRYTAGLVEATANGFGKVIGTKEDRKEFDNLAYSALATVRDPQLRRKLTPDYEPGCKRLIVSTGFYEAVQQPHVELVTEAIERIVPEGVMSADGVLHRLDILVLATGFHATAFMRPMQVIGRDGITIDQVFAEHFLNYRSVAVPHMPNFFMLNGPYAATSMSIVGLIELQASLVMRYIERSIERRAAIAPKVQRSREMLAQIRERSKRTVWGSGGCKSWYLDADGVPIYNPMTLKQQLEFFTTVDFADFDETPVVSEPNEEHPAIAGQMQDRTMPQP